MSELGMDVDLLTYGEGADVDIPNVRIIRVPRFRLFGPVKTGPSMLKLFLDLFVLLWTIGLLIRNRYRLVHAHEEAVFFCRFLKPIFRFKLIYDMHSSLPQQLVNFDFTESSTMRKIFQWLEDGSIRAADAVITICPDLADYVATINDDPEKHFLIENSIFDPVRLKSSDKLSERDEHANSDEHSIKDLPADRDFVVYAGTLEHYQGIDILVGAFADVVNEYPGAFLIIVGGTKEQVEKYSSLALECNIGKDSLFTGRLSQELANEFVDRAAIVVSPRSEGTNTPLKIYQQLASGTPLVATNIYSHTQVLGPDVAFLVEPTESGLAAGIMGALRNPQEALKLGRNAQGLYAREYSRQSYVAKMSGLISLLES